MSNWSDQEAADKLRLWNHILVLSYGTTDLSKVRHSRDPEGRAFFVAMDMAFASSGKMNDCVPVHRELVQYLAGWCRDTSQGYDEKGGPIGPNPNHFVRRAMDGFIQTLRQAVKRNQLSYVDDRILYGCFEVPRWLVEKYVDEAQRDAEHQNRLWDERPTMRDFLRTSA